MNALLRKEIRLLLPSWIIGVVVAFSAFLLTNESKSISGFKVVVFALPILLCPAILLMMALDSFGSEISAGTFTNLLSQPISRSKIWWTKILLLAAAFLLVWATWWFCFINNTKITMTPKELREAFVTAILIPMVIFSGGLWTVLLLRQVAAAFWFTLLVPAALTLPVLGFSEKYPNTTGPVITLILSLYSVAGFVFARWLFLRAQDVQWTGGVIALPEFLVRTKAKTSSTGEPNWRPRAALFFKELQLHQSQLVLAGVLAFVHLVVVLVRKFGGDFAKQPVMEMIFAGFWTLWFAMPLLIGCAAVAEERKMGTLENQLCLPVRRRTQFWIKFGSALLLSFVLGFLMPFLFEGKRIFPEIEIKAVDELAKNFAGDAFVRDLIHVLQLIEQFLPILVPLGIIAVIATVSFYASTLSRNTLQSLAPAVLGICVAFLFWIGANDVEKFFHYPLWRGWLIYLIGLPVMTLTFFALMYWNFIRVGIDWKVWRRNTAICIAMFAIVIATTTAIYHRAWEFLTPLEPAHGVARLEKSAAHINQSTGMRSTIYFADGRAWSTWMSFRAPSFKSIFLGDWTPFLNSRKFWDGTNWASITSSYSDDVGVKKDGSLWVSEGPRKRIEFGKNSLPQRPLIRFGEENNWKSVLSYSRKIFLLKTDRTLWNWGAEAIDGKKEWPGLRAFEPKRLGTNSDWVEISQMEYRTVFRNGDGEAWVYPQMFSKGTNNIKLNDEISIERAEHLDGITSIVGVSSRARSFGSLQVGVGKEGEFLVAAEWSHSRAHFGLIKKRIPLSKESDWLAVAGEGETVVTLKADGTLWKWNFPDDPLTKPDSASAVRLGEHSDWIAIADQFGGVTSLAADGSLWFWRFDDPSYSASPVSAIPPLLAASRRPQKIGNIFDTPRVPSRR